MERKVLSEERKKKGEIYEGVSYKNKIKSKKLARYESLRVGNVSVIKNMGNADRKERNTK